jgi:hypothetical protein
VPLLIRAGTRVPAWLSIAAALVVLLTARLAGAERTPVGEYQLKAVFLFNFAKFVDWPPEAFRTPAEPLTICVLGEDPFGATLDNVIAGQAIGGRPLAVRRISDARQVPGCQILFVTASAGRRVLTSLADAKQRGILTVGEAGNTTAEGMIIKFTVENGKVRFEINIVAAGDEKLRFSSRLLSLATVVRK